MAHRLYIPLALCASVQGLAFQAPEVTTFRGEDESGWTPAPTDSPQPHELLKRQFENTYATVFLAGSDNSCGYDWDNSLLACGALSFCNFWPAASTVNPWGKIACCGSYGDHNCLPVATCMDRDAYMTENCGPACSDDTQILKCTSLERPYCATGIFMTLGIKHWQCNNQPAAVFYYNTTYSGQTAGGRFSPIGVLDITSSTSTSYRTTSATTKPSKSSSIASMDELPKSSSTIRDIASTSSAPTPTVSIAITPVPLPDSKPATPTGAIAGGVVGGIALLALLGLAIFMIRRRKHIDTSPAGLNDNHPGKLPQDTNNSRMLRSAGIDDNDIAKLPVLKVGERGSVVSPQLMTDEQLRGLPEIIR